MSIIETYTWLNDHFEEPLKICEQLVPYFEKKDEKEIYQILKSFGMYSANRRTKEQYLELKEIDAWNKVNKLYLKYKQKWKGPDVPVFIFPIEKKSRLFSSANFGSKSGVAFKDKLFLFLSTEENIKEWEALLVHEYHHVCRLNRQRKKEKDYTLLDSVIMEGLAEHAVLDHCGEDYLNPWVKHYPLKTMEEVVETIFYPNLNLEKNNAKHDELLFGFGRVPRMIGYAVGFYLVERFREDNYFSTKISFSLESETFVSEKEK